MVSTSLPRLFLASTLAIVALSGTAPQALAAAPDRIHAAVTNAGFVAVANSVNPRAKLASDLGPTAGDTRIQGMSIRFNMTDAQAAALDQLLSDLQDPSSPRYHQWLTPAQYAAQFGLSSDDLNKVSAWLSGQGFTVTAVANGGTFIMFDGTVAQVDAAFSTSIHNLSLHGETHYGNVSDVSVPSALGGIVSAVTGLHNFRLQPRVRSSVVKPDFTSSISGAHFIAPGDIYTIYNSSPLLNANVNGTGQTIAVTGQVDIYPADITAFRSASGLSTSNLPTTVHAYGYDPGPPVCNSCSTGPNQGDLAESSIDLEWSGAMAPSASILFVNGVSVLPNSMAYAIDNNVAPIVTTSYGLCEAGWGYAELVALNVLFKQANAQGQTVLAAAADEGATDCDAGPSAIEGLAADFPASSPYVTGVGGTQLNEGNSTGATTYWSGTNGTTSGSALSYIPEAVWNDEPGFDAYGGGGGGVSAFFTKPAWQVGTGVPADGARDVPDIALDASDAHDPLLYCVNVAADGICTNGYRYASGTNAGDLNVAGGTSFDSQIFGGLLALVEQKIGSKVGNANQTIYALANNSKYYAPGQNTSSNSTVVFNDVTSGNNAMPCTAGTPNCPNGGSIGWTAGIGYDLASGWGSVNVANLASDWSLVTPLGTGSLGPGFSITNLATNPASVAAGATVTLTANVTGYTVTATNPLSTTATGELTTTPGTTPTGTVQFLANNVPLGSPVSLSGGTATYSWVTSCSALGQQVLTASYSGDANYQGSIGPVLTAGGASASSNGSTIQTPVELQVATNNCADYTVAASSTSVTVAAGGTIPAVTITVAPVNNFTGTVTFSAEVTNTSGYAPTVSFTPASVALTSSASATTSMTLSGITAALHLPKAPGQVDPAVIDPAVMVAQHPAGSKPWYAAGSGVTIASLLLLVLPRRRRLGGLLLAILAVALIGGATGCGSSQAGPPTTTTTVTNTTNSYAGTYTVVVSGTYTNSSGQKTQHIATVTYIIN